MDSVLLQGLLFVVGLFALYFGAEGLVRGAAELARAFRIRPVIIGLTVVAFGTSAPELVVSLIAAVRRSEALAVGNIVGSNIANVGLILGLAALLRPLRVEQGLIRKEVPMMLAASFLLWGLAWDLSIGRVEGGLLFSGLLAFILYSIRGAKLQEMDGADSQGAKRPRGLKQAGAGEAPAPAGSKAILRNALLVVIGLGGLLLGAQLLVRSAVAIARAIGVSEGIIGLSLVAVGTSLPELATSAVAAVKREADISVGNIVGSNLFNILSVIGLVALVRPLPVEPSWLTLQFPVMLLFSLALLPIMVGGRISRLEGGVLFAGYVAFLAWLF